MKIPFDKLTLWLIPYLLLMSICYNNGYWSLFSISIFSYYEAQDIIKDIAGPVFKFAGLTSAPFLFALAILLAWASGKDRPFPEVNDTGKSEIHDSVKSISETKDAKVNIAKKGLLSKVIGFIKQLLLFILSLTVFLIAVIIVTAIFFPYEDEGSFASKYMNSLGSIQSIRLCYAMVIPSAVIYFILKEIANINIQKSANISVIISSFILTLLIAYHYGRIDAYKIIAGTEFRFWVDSKGKAHKYLAKVNKHYIFLEDNKYINYRGNMNFRLDTLVFDPEITVITDDSLKGVRLDYYGPMSRYTKKSFKQEFIPRNGGKVF